MSFREITLEIITSVLMAQSLSKVEDLSLELACGFWGDFEEWTEEGCYRFVEAISLNLKCLRHIHLSGIPIRTKSFQPLSRLNIKSVSWKGRLLDVMDTAAGPRNGAVMAKVAMDAVFVEFEEKPEIKFVSLERDTPNSDFDTESRTT
jgi:hypothetical protein